MKIAKLEKLVDEWINNKRVFSKLEKCLKLYSDNERIIDVEEYENVERLVDDMQMDIIKKEGGFSIKNKIIIDA